MPVGKEQLGFSFLMVSEDPVSLQSVESAMSELGSKLHVTGTAEAALEHAARNRFDGVIFDLDLQASAVLIAAIRQKGWNRRVFTFLCAKEGVDMAAVLKVGGNGVLQKPLKADEVAARIHSLRTVIGRERRDYFRHHVTIPVRMTLGPEKRTGMIENLSQGGMAVLVSAAPATSTTVEFSFELPFGPRVDGKAEVVWSNEKGMGLEFVVLKGRSCDDLAEWLCHRALSG
jgi:DNA-binding response OmpR family regulator